jgi:hypothetical protein
LPRQICFTADDEVVRALNDEAKRTGQTRSSMINRLLKIAIENYDFFILKEGIIVKIPDIPLDEALTPELQVIFQALSLEQQRKARERWDELRKAQRGVEERREEIK